MSRSTTAGRSPVVRNTSCAISNARMPPYDHPTNTVGVSPDAGEQTVVPASLALDAVLVVNLGQRLADNRPNLMPLEQIGKRGEAVRGYR